MLTTRAPSRLLMFMLIIQLIAVSWSAAAACILNTGELPSTQGWTYHADGTISGGLPNNLPEGAVFSTDGTALYQNSFAAGYSGSSDNLYDKELTSGGTGSFQISIKVAVTAYGDPDGSNYYGFIVGIRDPVGEIYIGVTPTVLGLDSLGGPYTTDGDRVSYDNSVAHTYVIDGSLIAGVPFSVYRDGEFVATSSFRTDVTTPDLELFFGDGTGGADAAATIYSYSYSTNVPEPSGAAAISIALIPLVMRGRTARAARGLHPTDSRSHTTYDDVSIAAVDVGSNTGVAMKPTSWH